MMTLPNTQYLSLLSTERQREAAEYRLAALARRARECCRGTGSRFSRLVARLRLPGALGSGRTSR